MFEGFGILSQYFLKKIKAGLKFYEIELCISLVFVISYNKP